MVGVETATAVCEFSPAPFPSPPELAELCDRSVVVPPTAATAAAAADADADATSCVGPFEGGAK